MTKVQIAPSLLAADKADIGAAVRQLEDHIDVFHIDVMDGHFVPNISFGPSLVESVRPRTSRPLDVHLMVERPERWVSVYRDAGADWLSVHVEATAHLERTVSVIRESGARPGVALNPATPPSGLEYVLRNGDFVLVMSVNPGFGGQSFIAASYRKIAAVRSYLDAVGLDGVEIQIDGGIGAANAAACVAAGASILVAGSSITGAADPVAAAHALRDAANNTNPGD
jgi:ribulose-phosphate 3-epimerase